MIPGPEPDFLKGVIAAIIICGLLYVVIAVLWETWR